MTKQPLIAGMRTVKKETLKLITCWVSKSQDPGMVSTHHAVHAVHAVHHAHVYPFTCMSIVLGYAVEMKYRVRP